MPQGEIDAVWSAEPIKVCVVKTETTPLSRHGVFGDAIEAPLSNEGAALALVVSNAIGRRVQETRVRLSRVTTPHLERPRKSDAWRSERAVTVYSGVIFACGTQAPQRS